MRIQDLQRDSMHHAYLISGGVSELDTLIKEIGRLLGTVLLGNPDVLVLSGSALTVDMARQAVHRAGSASMVQGGYKIIVLAFTQATIEAQNALLKMLEEPSSGTHIFILTPNPDILLPTVLSRCQSVSLGSPTLKDNIEVDKFVNAHIQERLSMIDKLNKKKDKVAMIELLSGLEEYLSTHRQDIDASKWAISVKSVLQAQQYIRDKGAMSKILMESVALVL
jgi:DNA polymerase III delta prime subunit